MKSIPEIQKYMTPIPHTIGAEQSLATARDYMKKQDIRHLPVLSEGKLVGILTDRDVKMALGLNGVNPINTRVQDFALEDAYQVSPQAKLDEVAAELAERKIGSALVIDHGHLIGIFTTTDAMRALAELLRTRLQK
jgi:acetoin utilization protein AcuB